MEISKLLKHLEHLLVTAEISEEKKVTEATEVVLKAMRALLVARYPFEIYCPN